jgi:hypothetical protein
MDSCLRTCAIVCSNPAFAPSPSGDANAYLDSYTGPLNEADLDFEIRNGGGRGGGWANREEERDGGWWDGKKEAKELEAQVVFNPDSKPDGI